MSQDATLNATNRHLLDRGPLLHAEARIGGRDDPLIGLPGDSLRAIMGNFACDANPTTEDLAGFLKKPVADFLTVETRLQSLRGE